MGTVIIGPPPTPNGDLHLGHLAGPYLAADVHARYLRARGRDVLYATGTDDSQTYVVASARRRGVAPAELAASSTDAIRRTLALAGIEVDGFAPFDDGYRAAVLDFVGALRAAGKFEARTVRLPYDEVRGSFLYEGLVCGTCPVCLAESRGGLCETCGHPNNFDELIDPRSTTDPAHEIGYRRATILVLPLERYRARIAAHYERHAVRPHMAQLLRELLSRELPDFPITYPGDWGIPYAGQVLNAWVEGMPASMYCTAVAAGEADGPADTRWRAERGASLVYFLGFDNAYFWGVAHLALLMAHEGRYVLPRAIVSNEFYELENDKFSTSAGHVVWAHEIMAELPRDLVRFYLALTAPEHQRTNFDRAAVEHVARTRLVEPWEELRLRLGDGGEVSAAARARAALMLERFAACYELEGFCLPRAADQIVTQLGRLRRLTPEAPGDLHLETAALLACASPILIDAAAAAAPVWSLAPGAFDMATIQPFELPPLDAVAVG